MSKLNAIYSQLKNFKMSNHLFSCCFFFSFFFASCGANEPPLDIAQVTFANPGPTQCNLGDAVVALNQFTNEIDLTKKLFSTSEKKMPPLKIFQPTITKIRPTEKRKNKDKSIVSVIGGIDVSTNAASCNATVTTIPQSKMPKENTVAIIIPRPGQTLAGQTELCSGAIIAKTASETLIVTAAHCFNNLTNFNDVTANGAEVSLADVPSITPSNVTCWQRHKYYHNQAASNDDEMNLYDIAWIKVNSALSSTVTPILNSRSISTTEEKVIAGYGLINESSGGGTKRCASTYANANYSSRGDIIPAGSAATFNSISTRLLGPYIESLPSTPSETLLTVIGPIYNGLNSSNSIGACHGDSGGPVYVHTDSNASSPWTLAAITEGSSGLLTPEISNGVYTGANASGLNATSHFSLGTYAPCTQGYALFTTLKPYAAWLKASSGYGNIITTD